MGETGEEERQRRKDGGVKEGRRGSGEGDGGRREEGKKVDGRQREGSYQATAGPLTQARGEVWAGAVSRRADALEGAVGIGTHAALAEILLAALVHV